MRALAPSAALFACLALAAGCGRLTSTETLDAGTGGGAGLVGGGSGSSGGGTGSTGGGSNGGGSTGGGNGGGGSASGGGTGGGSTGNCNAHVGDGHRLANTSTTYASVRAIHIGPDGRLYVLDLHYAPNASTAVIHVYSSDPDRFPQGELGATTLKCAVDFTIDPSGNLYVFDFDEDYDNEPTILELNNSGTLVSSWGVPSSFSGGIYYDTRDSSLLISADLIFHFMPDGTQIGTTYGSSLGNFPYFTQLLRDDGSGTLWAGEITDSFLVTLDDNLDVLSHIGGRGAGAGMFDGTGDVHAAPDRFTFDLAGNIYVSDPLGSRLMKLDPQGDMLGKFDFSSQNVGPVTLDPNTGNLFLGRENSVDIICPF